MDGFCCAKVHSGRRGCNRSTFKSQKDTFVPAKKQGAFDALISDSDEEVEVEVEQKVQEDFPAIGNAPTKVASVTTGWASVAAAAPKPKPAPIKAKMPEPVAPAKVQQDNSAWMKTSGPSSKQRAPSMLASLGLTLTGMTPQMTRTGQPVA